ncbi:hypothetical protein [Cytobacillus sp. FSL R5-0596]|uniref:hypothetical protein n=1 Tax=Cytobacillus sp. FSL R5-0596 TaxID=2954696 RepID=UPI0030F7F098
MNEVIQSLQSMREVYAEFPKRLDGAQEELKKVDSEIQDILHVIELTNFDACKGYKWAKELQKLRKERRRLKDEIESLEPIKELLSYQKPSEKNINKILGDVRKIETRHKNRGYSMRVRHDLQELMR